MQSQRPEVITLILEAENISLQISGNTILTSLNITIGEGELVGLIGPNGAGKTSLLRILANLQKPDSGQLTLNQQPLDKIDRKHFARLLGYLEQGAPVHWPLEVRRLVELGRLPHLAPWSQLSAQDDRVVTKAMALAEVSHLSDRIVSTLSGGERLRVLIARMFATEPKLILADEPIAALDPYHQLHTMELFREHCDRGGSAVVVMHDLNTAARFCHRLVLLNKGSIIREGSAKEVLQPQLLEQVYGISADIIEDANAGLIVIPKARFNR